MKTRNYLNETDPYYKSKTQKQWKKEKRAINVGAVGQRMYVNGMKQVIVRYFREDETHLVTPEEKEAWRQEDRARRVAKQKIKEQKKLEKQKEVERLNRIKSVPHDKMICFDVETTGLSPYADEILQLSIIDGDGEVLFNEYIKPQRLKSWEAAQKIHGISPEMVGKKKCIDEYVIQLNHIFSSVELIIGYNINTFDLHFLSEAGIFVPAEILTYDVMLEFAPIYGEWDYYRKDYRWQKLEVCARYYNYTGNVAYHDSLEDVRATLHCFHSMLKEEPII